MTEPTIDDLIAFVKWVLSCDIDADDKPKWEAILASLERLKRIESQSVPVEPDEVSEMRSYTYRQAETCIKYIDALQSALKLAQEELDAEKECKNATARAYERAESTVKRMVGLMKEPSEGILDAPREFLKGITLGWKSTGAMREHLTLSGIDFSMLPDWFKTGDQHITKSGQAACIFAFMSAELLNEIGRAG